MFMGHFEVRYYTLEKVLKVDMVKLAYKLLKTWLSINNNIMCYWAKVNRYFKWILYLM